MAESRHNPLAADEESAFLRGYVALYIGDVETNGKVKYFGRSLPPKCALRKCFQSDDGERFYCNNGACNKHLSRRTKHDRYSRYAHLDPARPERVPVVIGKPPAHAWPIIPFKCPSCESREINMSLSSNQYECKSCFYAWR